MQIGTWILGGIVALTGIVSSGASAQTPVCAFIADGTIYTENGDLVVLGTDAWGYNYQARTFSGSYCDAQRGAPCPAAYEDIAVTMRWSNDWLSRNDCDLDGRLDRHFGYDSYRGSGAWTTTNMVGSYDDGAGGECVWRTRFVAFAAPLDATLVDGEWLDADGYLLGPTIWNQFYVTTDTFTDSCQ